MDYLHVISEQIAHLPAANTRNLRLTFLLGEAARTHFIAVGLHDQFAAIAGNSALSPEGRTAEARKAVAKSVVSINRTGRALDEMARRIAERDQRNRRPKDLDPGDAAGAIRETRLLDLIRGMKSNAQRLSALEKYPELMIAALRNSNIESGITDQMRSHLEKQFVAADPVRACVAADITVVREALSVVTESLQLTRAMACEGAGFKHHSEFNAWATDALAERIEAVEAAESEMMDSIEAISP